VRLFIQITSPLSVLIASQTALRTTAPSEPSPLSGLNPHAIGGPFSGYTTTATATPCRPRRGRFPAHEDQIAQITLLRQYLSLGPVWAGE